MELSVVVPVYNNAATLAELAARLATAMQGRVRAYELILVDDGSRDESWAVISALARESSVVRGVRLSRNFGQHPAIAAGFEAASGEIVVLMDADLEDRPESIPMLVEAIEAGADIAYTTAPTPEGVRRRWSSALFHRAFSMAVRADVPPNIGTLRAFTRKVREAVLSYREYNVLYGPLMFFLGFDCAFVQVERDARREGRSSYSFLRRLRLAQTTLMSYTNLPTKFLMVLGFSIFAAVALYIAVIIAQYLMHGVEAPPGLILLALLVLTSLAINLVAFGVLGSYLFRVYQEVLGRPRFHVRADTGATRLKKESGE